METRANYVLIGAFALLGFFGLIAFFLWFARVELDRQFAYFDVRFSTVSGLSRASEVRFAGLPVGQVVDVRLAPEGDGSVLVRLEVGADTPVRVGSVATIESLGVTGVSYVGISSGDPRGPLLRETVEGIPEIPSGRSVLQTLTEDAPEIVSQALEVMRMLGQFASEENRGRIEAILVNLEDSSGDLGAALQDFAAITGIVGSAATDIAFFTTQIEPLVTGLEQTLGTADTALAAVADGAEQVGQVLASGDEVLIAARQALDAINRVADEEVPPMLTELRAAAAGLRREVETLGPAARVLIDEYTATGAAAGARLAEAEALIARLETTLASVDRAAVAAEALVAGDGTALAAAATRLAEEDVPRALADLRAASASARIMADDVAGLIELELPRVFDDLRLTSVTLRDQVAALGTDARGMIAELTATGSAATARLTEAEALIVSLNETLVSVERAADSVGALVAGDGAALVAETRTMIEGAGVAVASVTRIAENDLPAILADVRSATETAAQVVTDVGADLTSATGRIETLSDGAAEAVAEIRDTFARATATLDAIDAALVTGGRTLEAAERAFDGAERLIDGDLAALAADLRGMIDELEATLAVVAADVPEISADLRRASASADEAFAELETMARELRAPVAGFADSALPQFAQLAREARSLVASFDRLVRQLERDPSRVLFSRPPPEFRR